MNDRKKNYTKFLSTLIIKYKMANYMYARSLLH